MMSQHNQFVHITECPHWATPGPGMASRLFQNAHLDQFRVIRSLYCVVNYSISLFSLLCDCVIMR